MRLRIWACVGVMLAQGCSSADHSRGSFEDSFQDDDLPMGGCSGTGCATESGDAGPRAPVGDPCDGASHCESGACAATFRDGDPGPLTCRAACIEADDAEAWCSDDASCCAGLVCGPRGLCGPAPEADGGSEAGPDGSSSDG